MQLRPFTNAWYLGILIGKAPVFLSSLLPPFLSLLLSSPLSFHLSEFV